MFFLINYARLRSFCNNLKKNVCTIKTDIVRCYFSFKHYSIEDKLRYKHQYPRDQVKQWWACLLLERVTTKEQ